MSPVDEAVLRGVVPQVIGVLVRRGADFAAAEDAVQDALLEALRSWPDDPPRDPKGWLVTVAWRRFLDAVRSEGARQRRELAVDAEPEHLGEELPVGAAPVTADDVLDMHEFLADFSGDMRALLAA